MRPFALALLTLTSVGIGAEPKPSKWSGEVNVPDPTAVTFD